MSLDLDLIARRAAQWNEEAFAETKIFRQNKQSSSHSEPASFQELKGLLEKAQSPADPCNQILLLGNSEAPKGIFVSYWNEKSFTGQGLCIARIFLDKHDPESLDWASRILKPTLKGLPEELSFEVAESLSDLFPTILDAGCFIESIKIGGIVNEGVDFFRRHPKVLPKGLQLRTAVASDVGTVLDIYRKGFEEKYCWFSAWESHLQAKAEGFEQSLERGDLHWILERQGLPLGYCQVSKNDYGAFHFFGIAGGIEPVLLPEIQGQGVAWFLYQESLSVLKETGHRVYIGNTAQPSVMKIARALGRQRIATHFRKKGFFPAEHFSQFS